uniref:JmjC domain-containing protein n=1 Tax=viral metagenome TaxID=1070528 RepID=A0A6C0DYP9_9ZZZZ
MKLIILLILILIFIIIIRLNYKSLNLEKHKNSSSLYAHFSEIDSYNYFIFPRLLFTHPQKFLVKKGESIYIPKKWWHWIKTTKKTFAINFWFNNKNNINNPFILTNPIINIDINSLDNENVTVWNSLNNDSEKNNFKVFYNSKKDNKYIITLDNYDLGMSNSNIKNKLKPYIKFPENDKINVNNEYDYNVWISSGKHDTGLHYDDEDGLLTVIEGIKEIIMFPPSDSKYLYPYDVKYKWINKESRKFKYNSYTDIGLVSGISSSMLLYETCKNNVRVLSNISKLYEKFDKKKLIWGFKKNKDIYRWEIYLYTLDENIRITSWDIDSSSYNISNVEHYYYKYDKEYINEIISLPFWGCGKYKKDNVLYDESKIFVIDTYKSFYENYDNYMKKLEFENIKDKFKNIILNKYSCYEISIFNKTKNQIFVLYLGITNEEFLNFLITSSYPDNIIKYIKNKILLNEYNINNEIAIIYDTNTLEIIRSGFYGML